MLYGELPEIKRADGGEPIRGFPVEILNPPKTSVLRLPKDEEILERLSKSRTILTDLGRGRSDSKATSNTKADFELFQKLRLDQGPEFDEFEAAKAIGRITYCRVASCERLGSQFEIKLETCAGETVHTLKAPPESAMFSYRESILARRDLGRGKEELRYRHSVAVELYDACGGTATGYAAGTAVPPHHKFHVATEVARAHDELDAPPDPNF
jgi:hypothetical protein